MKRSTERDRREEKKQDRIRSPFPESAAKVIGHVIVLIGGEWGEMALAQNEQEMGHTNVYIL